MVAYDVGRGKADVPINAKAKQSPGRQVLKADQEEGQMSNYPRCIEILMPHSDPFHVCELGTHFSFFQDPSKDATVSQFLSREG